MTPVPLVHPQPSEEAKNLARKILLPIIERSEDCRMPASVAQRMSVPAIALYIDEALDRVSAQALERAAMLIDVECARVLAKQTAGKTDQRYEESVNLNLRMMAVMLPDLSARVRALIPGGK